MRLLIFSVAMIAPALAGAASFDCDKATGRVERLVCSDPELSQLDDALDLAYAAAVETQDPAVKTAQRRWLAERNGCRDKACVKTLYERRLGTLRDAAGINCDPASGAVETDRCLGPVRGKASDPFDDKVLTCEEMRRYPDLIFGLQGGIDLGSGTGSPIEVDYSCNQSLASLPFLQKLKELTETIRSEGGSQICTGTIINAHWRYYHFGLLMAGFAPGKLLKYDADNKKFADLYPQWLDENLLGYFERWSYESIYNFELHRTYMAELGRATAQLAQHYQKAFRFPKAKAETLASLGTKLFLVRAAGTFPKDSISETARILRAAGAARGSMAELTAGIDGMYIDYVRIGLNIALLMQRPAAHVSLLAERAETLNYGDESPLFFALRNRDNVRFLLDRGADVNYRNTFGKTPLYYAIGFDDQPVVDLLLDRGARINQRYAIDPKNQQLDDCAYRIEHIGRTPLMHAAQHAGVAMIRLLLKRGAKLDDVDAVGYNATAYALVSERRENSAYLKSLGLVAPKIEQEIAQRRKMTSCLNAAQAKKLQGKARSDFYVSCMRS